LQSQKKKIGIETRAEKQIAVYFPISVTENACIKDTTVLTKQNMQFFLSNLFQALPIHPFQIQI
jgi:hypothetical protein